MNSSTEADSKVFWVIFVIYQPTDPKKYIGKTPMSIVKREIFSIVVYYIIFVLPL